MIDAVDMAAQQAQEVAGQYINCPVELLPDGSRLWRVAPGTEVHPINITLNGLHGWKLQSCDELGNCRLERGFDHVFAHWRNLRIIPGSRKAPTKATLSAEARRALPDVLRSRARQLIGDGYSHEFVHVLITAANELEQQS